MRIVHLGLGNFFRAHAAWYTENAADADAWGIAAFTGRSAVVPVSLAEQEGLYALLVRRGEGPRADVMSSVSRVHAAHDLEALRSYFRSSAMRIVTLTVTEAGYRRNAAGELDLSDPEVQADLEALRTDPLGGSVSTVPGKLVAGLLVRRASAGGALAIVPNDNLPENGAMVAGIIEQFAGAVDPSLTAWTRSTVSCVTTMVDRITPATTDEDRATVTALLGVRDAETVPTEPFSEWVLAGDFPGGRPRWEDAGARFVSDVGPYEQRKLWLLNGAHSLMAYAGSALGHHTVAEAVADPLIRGWVEEWWDAAAPHLSLPRADVLSYRAELLQRFSNPGIRHQLSQIAVDGSQKIPVRAVPVLAADLADGRAEEGAVRLLAAWLLHLEGYGCPVNDVQRTELSALLGGTREDLVAGVLRRFGLDAEPLSSAVRGVLHELEGRASLTATGP